MNAITAYRALEDRFEKMAVLGEALSVLHWDAAVMMPSGGAGPRAEQLSALRVMGHELLTAPETADLIAAADAADLDDWRQANLREMARGHARAAALPPDLVAAFSKACSECEHAWRGARLENDFASVKPLLAEVLTLTRRRAEILSEALGLSPYDALLDGFEPGASERRIEALFSDYRAFLPDFLAAVLERQDREGPKPTLSGAFDVGRQEALCRELAAVAGFDFDAGRIDQSAHPFSTGFPGDQRITVRYNAADPTFAIMAVLHEAGHALYERNLPPDWRRQPVGSARGMGLHESQSLLIEMQASRSPEFLSALAPKLREAFGAQDAFTDEALQRLVHWVQPDFIRVDADEVTYPAHVILRFNLERALLRDDLPLEDLPAAWNDGMTELLGVTPPTDALGCLQDIHWYDGAIGYFPTYTLGAMAAAQLFQAACAADPEIKPALARHDMNGLQAWLTENVHAHGSRMSSDAVLEAATGRPLDPKAFEAHLTERYLGA
ncbi:MAG: carboxypeptidase M32 [Alphaproteobacteria bacterium]|nr:carboxypeptidase M32 [Alphaproteobacteria bacterium]